MIKVDAVSNGWILTHQIDDERPEVEVFESFNSDEDKVKAFQRLLYSISDIMGPMFSRYSQHRIKICIVSGDKYQGENRASCEFEASGRQDVEASEGRKDCD